MQSSAVLGGVAVQKSSTSDGKYTGKAITGIQSKVGVIATTKPGSGSGSMAGRCNGATKGSTALTLGTGHGNGLCAVTDTGSHSGRGSALATAMCNGGIGVDTTLFEEGGVDGGV